MCAIFQISSILHLTTKQPFTDREVNGYSITEVADECSKSTGANCVHLLCLKGLVKIHKGHTQTQTDPTLQ